MKKLIGFCGLPGSGKSTAIESINDLGKIIIMGNIVRNELQERNIPLTDENLGNIAKSLREKYGKGIIAKKCVELIKKQNNIVLFIDGLRSMEEVKVFRNYWKFPIIAITTSQKKRFNIIRKRARKDDPKSLEELILRDQREMNFGLKEVIEKADFTIINDTTKKDLKKKTRRLVLSILKDY